MKSMFHAPALALVSLLLFNPTAIAAEISKNFTITNRVTGKAIHRDDYKGKIILLDFFAYWCPPCVTSSPIVEKEIGDFYRNKGGNAHGVDVEVIGVNIEGNNAAATDDFISEVGYHTVADDFDLPNGAWAQFGEGFIPHFVIINGTSGGSHQQWEVLHSDSGFSGSQFYKDIIDSIKPGATVLAPEIEIQQVRSGKLIDGVTKKSFGTVRVGARSATKTFIIRNTGKAVLSGLAIGKAGKHAGDFVTGTLNKQSLSPREEGRFTVTFSPKSKGRRTADIRIFSNDTDENPFNIPVAGMGVK